MIQEWKDQHSKTTQGMSPFTLPLLRVKLIDFTKCFTNFVITATNINTIKPKDGDRQLAANFRGVQKFTIKMILLKKSLCSVVYCILTETPPPPPPKKKKTKNKKQTKKNKQIQKPINIHYSGIYNSSLSAPPFYKGQL